MRSKNTASHIGHLGRKPELKYNSNGTPYARFTIACNFSYKRNGEWTQDVDWIPFVAYGKLAEVAAKYLDKGSHVSIESRLKPWKSEKDGETRYGMNVVATQILFLDAKNQPSSPEQLAEGPDHGETVEPDDIPF